MRWGLSYFILSGLLLIACQGQKAGDRRLKPKALLDPIVGDHHYSDVFDDNTQLERVHSELMPSFVARVTFWNEEVRRAYIRELSGRLRMSAEEEANLAKEELQENEAYVVFVLNMGTRDQKWNNLHQKRSNWRVSLEDPSSSVKVAPERIEILSNRDDANKYFYDTEDSFMKLYRIRFPRESIGDLKNFVFHISGVRGAAEFAFKNDLGTGKP